MGQSSSSHHSPPRRSTPTHHRSTPLPPPSSTRPEPEPEPEPVNFPNQITSTVDYSFQIPDDCLALIFHFLNSADRKRCSLVSKRWLLVEGQSRQRLTLNANTDFTPFISSLFTRFDSVTKLSLRCDRRSVSIDDNGIILISSLCPKLIRVKLRGCREITDVGMSALGKNCNFLKKFSCGSCNFGAKGMNALLENCGSLEDLSVKRLRGVNGDGMAELIGVGSVAKKLKSVHLKELYNGQMFAPLISGAKWLKSLKLIRCLGDWDEILEIVCLDGSVSLLVEVHLERVQVSDVGLLALSNCLSLEVLHIVKTPDCTDSGVIAVAGRCKGLRKVHIDGWKTNRIGHDALVAIAKNSVNLQELVLIGLNPSLMSMEQIAMNCKKLERLALCGSETIADGEISCIASKCVALKKVCIKGCPVSDEGIVAFALGCPNLVKIKVRKCKNVTGEVGDWLRARRESLLVYLDVEPETVDASSESGAQEELVDLPATETNVVVAQPEPLATSSSGRGSIFKTRFGIFGGRGLACTFRRWSVGKSSSSNGNS